MHGMKLGKNRRAKKAKVAGDSTPIVRHGKQASPSGTDSNSANGVANLQGTSFVG
jgi:hypothetical protein